MSLIHWIHFSDLHYNKVGMQTDTMREKLPDYISELSAANSINYIFFTGDIRYAPKKTFQNEAADYFNKLCLAAKVEKENLFVVLGNHDVDRDNEERLNAITELEKDYIDNDSVIDRNQIAKLKKGREDCFKLLNKIITEKQFECHTDPNKLHFLIETNDFNIVHVDSVLTYCESKQNEFFIGTYALKNVFKECNNKKPIVVLSHYSIDSLDPTEQKAVLRLLKDYNVQLWFAGHKHTDIIYKERDYFFVAHSGNQTFEKLTSPSFVEGFLDTCSGEGYFKVHKWNNSAGWAVYQTLTDKTDLKENCYRQDKTIYPFKLDKWLKANGKKIFDTTEEYYQVKKYLLGYKGNSFLVKTLINDLNINECEIKNSLSILQKEGFIRPLNYAKTQWEIIRVDR